MGIATSNTLRSWQWRLVTPKAGKQGLARVRSYRVIASYTEEVTIDMTDPDMGSPLVESVEVDYWGDPPMAWGSTYPSRARGARNVPSVAHVGMPAPLGGDSRAGNARPPRRVTQVGSPGLEATASSGGIPVAEDTGALLLLSPDKGDWPDPDPRVTTREEL